MDIKISVGQCVFEGASAEEHKARQQVYADRLCAKLDAKWEGCIAAFRVFNDSRPLSVDVGYEAEMNGDGEAVKEAVREMSGEAWMEACEAKLVRIECGESTEIVEAGSSELEDRFGVEARMWAERRDSSSGAVEQLWKHGATLTIL